jgi:hypothetical protein
MESEIFVYEFLFRTYSSGAVKGFDNPSAGVQ